MTQAKQTPLYDSRFEHDACGIGAVVDIKGRASHSIVDSALKVVEKLEHRAGKDAEGKTGDGVGIMLQVPHEFMTRVMRQQGTDLGMARDYGVGMIFFPQNAIARSRAKKLLEILAAKENLKVLGWREVPVRPEILGETARSCMPCIWQCFIRRPEEVSRGLDFDRRLYVLRREYEHSVKDTYVCSMSSRTIVYKGMFLVSQLRGFYPDLDERDFASALALVHSRFSTNTTPSWERAHPNRLLLHNGEINTIRGNIDRMLAREETMHAQALSADMDKVLPVVEQSGSDSAMLDNTLEFLMFSGMELPKAVAITVPEPWRRNRDMSRARRDMYHYYATMMEPWDGPAALLFSDGDIVGAALDRNGLRPCRWYELSDGRLILASEVGVLDIPAKKILRKSRLRPGSMLVIDTVKGRIVEDGELKEAYASRRPYGEWLDRELVHLSELPIPNRRVPVCSQELRDKLYKVFGYTWEDLDSYILPMAQSGSEPIAAMGADEPLAVLSKKHRPLFDYFRQLFAQVTNPPIDAQREEIVTDTTVYVGSDGNLLQDAPENCRVLQINNPILTRTDLMKIQALSMPGLRAGVISLLYYKNTPLDRALDRMFVDCDKAWRSGVNILILSDRGVDENHTAIPSLLAVSALEQYLVRTKKRTAVSVILESAEPRTVHHFATLLGYGARAVCPYLAHECVTELCEKGLLDKDPHEAVEAYNSAVLHGVVKIASKMGISTVQSYQSAQIFEIVGISRSVVDKYFTNTVSRVEGIGMEEIEETVLYRHDQAFDCMELGIDPTLDSVGIHKYRAGEAAEDHLYDPSVILTLQKAVQTCDYELYKKYAAMVDEKSIGHHLRGLLEFKSGAEPIPVEQVEPAEDIVRRFKTGAMSYGSLSQEAHECLAVAMNSIGGCSNSGEGGEDPARLHSDRCSAIKQVASGRFGVTSEYLTSAREIQIKMAQGAKPGEGGHLPGNKVWPWVARTRYSTPGVSLISPPPHHDIYSIEDLAQLIFDLKNANCKADISVKLVSEAGVGTIASGVAKAGAQLVLISGADGGTGAASIGSIHNAGLPWELGLAETHQTLIRNGLRSRVRLETDGKLMTGRDVAIACMLGAEEFGFATLPLVAMGCAMMRVCNKDTCPMGIATQNPELRRRFAGKPEHVVNLMKFIAQDLREHMAELGVRTVDELVGRTDLLREREVGGKAACVDVSPLLASCGADRFDPRAAYDFHLEETPDEKYLLPMLEKGENTCEMPISCTDRTFGAIFGAELTRRYGGSLADDSYRIRLRGGAGQSFGAFIPKGLTLELEGDANDYFGKGLSGGKLIVYPDRDSRFDPSENVIIGNVALYGATGGRAYINGVAGERFCVRNSGASAVVEGVGDHGCEYMTGGRAVVLGPVGRNFAAGMSGGIAYVLDQDHDLYLKVNKELVAVEPVHEKNDIAELRELITQHWKATGSPKAAWLLENFEARAPEFKKITPRDYSAMLEGIAAFEGKGMSRSQAELEAFLARRK